MPNQVQLEVQPVKAITHRKYFYCFLKLELYMSERGNPDIKTNRRMGRREPPYKDEAYLG